jgi:O-antigen/teichoic acid export membrane protein
MNPKRQFTQKTFAKDVSLLVTGTTFAQALTLIASPILTRIYGPEAFGLFAIFTSLTSILGVIICLRYQLSIMLPESEEEAINILGLCFIIVTIISLLIVPIIWFGQATICELLNAPDLGPYLWFIPPFAFFSGLYLALNFWNSRTKQYQRLAISRITKSVSTTGTQIGAGIGISPGGGSLIGADLLGQFVATLVLGAQIWRDDCILIKKHLKFTQVKAVFYRYKKFPLIDTLSSLLNSISWQLPVFLLSIFFSPIVVGFYALGFRILQFPMSLVGSSISQVFFQRASEALREGTLTSLVEDMFKILILIGLYPILILTFIGQDVFSLIFGQIWAEAGLYTQILSIWALVWFISSPLSMLYIVLEKQEFGLKFNIINFITRIGSLIIGGLLGSPIIALILFASSGIAIYGYLEFAMLKYSGVKISRAIEIIISNLILFIPTGFILILLKLFGADSIILVIVSVTLCLLYYAYIIKRENQIKEMLKTIGPVGRFLDRFYP